MATASSNRVSPRRLALLLVAAGCVVLWRVPDHAAQPQRAERRPAAEARAPAAIERARILGKAYYEQGKYAEAIAEFQKVIASGQALASDHLALGQSLLQANRLDAALGELTTAKQMAPHLVAADYNLGILYKRELRYPDAEAALKRVAAADPTDPATWFNLGVVYFAEKKLPQALDAHRHVLDMGFARAKNFYVASAFHMFTILIRLGRRRDAERYLAINQKFRNAVPGIAMQYPALEAGKYGVILTPRPSAAPPSAPQPAPIRFADISSELGVTLPAVRTPEMDRAHRVASRIAEPSVTVGDYDGDGLPDLYVVVPAGSNHLLHNNGDGTFTDVTARTGLRGQGASLSATFADYDNSGHPSLFAAGVGGVILYHNNGNGTFTDVTAKAGLKGEPGEIASRAVLFDMDNDGFLDLVVTVYGNLDRASSRAANSPGLQATVNHLYRNNGDGTFADVTSSSGLASAKGRMLGAVFADFNNDGYTDLLFFRADGPPSLFLNQGEGKFVDRTPEAGTALARSDPLSVQVADFDHDGNLDLALWSRKGYQVLRNRGDATFEAAAELPQVRPPDSPRAFRGTVADLEGDGFDDLVVADDRGKLHALVNRGGGRFEEGGAQFPAQLGRLGFLLPGWIRDPGRITLLGATASGKLAALAKEGPAAHWVEVKLDGFKSNKQGVGDVVEFKAGNFYKKVVATGNPVRAFTGPLAKLDVVRVTWPNLVVQNAIDVMAGKPITVRESQRLASSCPFLYVWDRSRYRFLTDIMGVAPLGELAPDGTYVKPNPDQIVRLGRRAHERRGEFVFKITDEMREADYFDRLRLFAVDHPAGVAIYANEIYSSMAPPLELYLVQRQQPPVSAVDDHGRTVLPLIARNDGRYPTDFRRNRILGIADLHALTLDLGPFPDASHVALYLTGWVFWTDSNAARALTTNPRLKMIDPYIQVRDARGRWVTVIPDMGLPAGTNRTMRVNLTGKFLTPDHHIRILTNLCVYWDRIFFTTDDARIPLVPAPEMQASKRLDVFELPLVAADLHYRGFSTPTVDPAHIQPDRFDYSFRMPQAPWNPARGPYTRYGPVTELVTHADDHLVAMAAGDEMTVEFDPSHLPPLKPGWVRDLFLYARGYAKDGEPNTADFRSVLPMPFYAMPNYPPASQPKDSGYRRYLEDYETRPAHLLIPPLAPPVGNQ